MIRSIRPLLWQNTHKANSFSYEKLYHHFSSSTRLRYQTIKFSFTQTQRFTNFAKLVTKAPSTSKKNGFGSVLVGVISTIVIGTTISNNIKQNTGTQTIEEEFYALKKIVHKKVYEQKYADAEELCSQFIQNKRALQQQMPDDFSLKYYLALAEISLATLHTQQRSYNLATDELEHVIHNFSETPPPDEKNRNTEILYLSYSLKGVLDCVISDFRAAEHSFTQATQFGLQMDNIDITLVQIMFNLGNVYLELMELDKSKQAFDDALIQYKKLKDKSAEALRLKAELLYSLALILSTKGGQKDKIKEYMDESLALLEKTLGTNHSQYKHYKDKLNSWIHK